MCEHQRSRIFINMRKEEAYIFSKVDLSAKFQMESCFHLSLKIQSNNRNGYHRTSQNSLKL